MIKRAIKGIFKSQFSRSFWPAFFATLAGVILSALLAYHFWSVQQDTCGISNFIYERGRFILTKHNDTSFLKSFRIAKSSDF